MTPTTAPSAEGGIPRPVQAPPAAQDDDVTNGYVPWSTSSMTPCAPSHRSFAPDASRAFSQALVSVTKRASFFPHST